MARIARSWPHVVPKRITAIREELAQLLICTWAKAWLPKVHQNWWRILKKRIQINIGCCEQHSCRMRLNCSRYVATAIVYEIRVPSGRCILTITDTDLDQGFMRDPVEHVTRVQKVFQRVRRGSSGDRKNRSVGCSGSREKFSGPWEAKVLLLLGITVEKSNSNNEYAFCSILL